MSWTGLARAFGRAAAAPEGSVERAVTDAMRAHPFMVAGTGRDDTLLMQAHAGLLVKGGAEGVHCAALADGTAVALKVSDGASRARMPLLVAALRHLGLASDTLEELATSPVLGGGRPVGVTEVIPGALSW
jgi:L-asparaginase II